MSRETLSKSYEHLEVEGETLSKCLEVVLKLEEKLSKFSQSILKSEVYYEDTLKSSESIIKVLSTSLGVGRGILSRYLKLEGNIIQMLSTLFKITRPSPPQNFCKGTAGQNNAPLTVHE